MKKKVYREKVQAIADKYPRGFAMVLALAGPPPLPPKEIPTAEVQSNLDDLEAACEKFDTMLRFSEIVSGDDL